MPGSGSAVGSPPSRHELSSTQWLHELRARGAGGRIRRVVFRATRSTIFSVTGRGTVLNLNASFRRSPAELLDEFAVLLGNSHGRAAAAERRRLALRRIRGWPPLVEAIRSARAADHANGKAPGARGPRSRCCATPEQRAYLRALYATLRDRHFLGRLPDEVPIRLSARMSRRLGQIRLLDGPPRRVAEIALSADLVLDDNETQRLDTMLHEMAHAEAFLVHGHRGHGPIWRRIAVRVGCEPRACTAAHVVRRRTGPRR